MGTNGLVPILAVANSTEIDAPADDAAVPASKDPAFEEIFASQFQYVWNALRRLGIPQRDLEDVVHDVFVQVYRQRAQYDPSRAIRPWLFAFAFRVASDYRRLARNRFEMLEPAAEGADTQPRADDSLVRAEAISVGYAALETLEMGLRAVFILYELDGCSMKEIAASLDIPVNTAYSRLRLAREQFHQALGRWRKRRGL